MTPLRVLLMLLLALSLAAATAAGDRARRSPPRVGTGVTPHPGTATLPRFALFGWVAERTPASTALCFVALGLAAMSVVLWNARALDAFAVWAVIYGLVNSGVVALLALVLDETFGTAQIGRLLGVAMVFCMSATMIGNNFSAAVFERTGSYDLAWQSYTILMLVTLLPVFWLQRRA